MSVILAGTTLTNGLVLESDTAGNLVIKTGAAGVTAATFNSGGTAVISALSVTSLALSGALGVAQGGTGLTSTPTNGQLLIGNGTGFTLATLTAGDGMTITNNAGSISLSAAGLPAMNIVSGTTQTAVVNNHYILTNAAATTVTLPASPAAGDVVWVTVANGLSTNVIARNGKKINELEEDMTIDAAYAGIQLRFSGDTEGWVFT
jgi:hypothetical protein